MFITLLVTLAAAPTAPSPAAIDGSRKALVACLKDAGSAAKMPDVTADGFRDFARGRCAAQAAAFTGAMVSFDMKNGASRTSATEGAQMAVDDYLETARNNYASKVAD